MTAYATDAQLQAFTGSSSLPMDTPRLLVRASEVVKQALVTAVYDVADAVVLAALADATCAQVEFWLAGDEEDDVLGPVQGISLAGMQVQYGAGTNRATPAYLAPRAHRILANAGLLNGRVL